MKGQTIGFQGQRIQICNPILDTIGMVLTPIGHIMTVHHLVGMKKIANKCRIRGFVVKNFISQPDFKTLRYKHSKS